jgi:hypothetical protein
MIRKVRGYATTFNQVGIVGKEFEQFLPRAFDRLLASTPRIDLRWSEHERSAPQLASTAEGTLSLFADAYGLGFEALLDVDDLDNIGRLGAIVRRENPMAFCSVGGLIINNKRSLSAGSYLITDATIEHITICDRTAVYQGSAVWAAGPLDLAPSKIQSLAARWATGRAEWKRKLAAQQQSAQSSKSAVISALVSSRERQFAAFRNMIRAQPGRFYGEILGHAGFSKAALLASTRRT